MKITEIRGDHLRCMLGEPIGNAVTMRTGCGSRSRSVWRIGRATGPWRLPACVLPTGLTDA